MTEEAVVQPSNLESVDRVIRNILSEMRGMQPHRPEHWECDSRGPTLPAMADTLLKLAQLRLSLAAIPEMLVGKSQSAPENVITVPLTISWGESESVTPPGATA